MGDLIASAGATVGGLTIIGTAAWRWMIGPSLKRLVAEIVEAQNAASLTPVMRELSINGGSSLKDRVVRIDERLEAHIAFHQTEGSNQ